MKKAEAIKFFGSQARLAHALEIKRQAVHGWGDIIPIGRAYQIQVVTKGKLKVDLSVYA